MTYSVDTEESIMWHHSIENPGIPPEYHLYLMKLLHICRFLMVFSLIAAYLNDTNSLEVIKCISLSIEKKQRMALLFCEF